MTTIAGIVDEWFLNLPPSPLAQAAARLDLIRDLQNHFDAATQQAFLDGYREATADARRDQHDQRKTLDEQGGAV